MIITHPDFFEVAQDYGAYRAGQGESVAVVKSTDIYDQYNGGVKSAEAIRDYLANAYENWQIQPKYVLLIGDADETAVLVDSENKEIIGYNPNISTDYLPAHYEFTLVFEHPTPLDAWYAKLTKNVQGEYDGLSRSICGAYHGPVIS